MGFYEDKLKKRHQPRAVDKRIEREAKRRRKEHEKRIKDSKKHAKRSFPKHNQSQQSSRSVTFASNLKFFSGDDGMQTRESRKKQPSKKATKKNYLDFLQESIDSKPLQKQSDNDEFLELKRTPMTFEQSDVIMPMKSIQRSKPMIEDYEVMRDSTPSSFFPSTAGQLDHFTSTVERVGQNTLLSSSFPQDDQSTTFDLPPPSQGSTRTTSDTLFSTLSNTKERKSRRKRRGSKVLAKVMNTYAEAAEVLPKLTTPPSTPQAPPNCIPSDHIRYTGPRKTPKTRRMIKEDQWQRSLFTSQSTRSTRPDITQHPKINALLHQVYEDYSKSATTLKSPQFETTKKLNPFAWKDARIHALNERIRNAAAQQAKWDRMVKDVKQMRVKKKKIKEIRNRFKTQQQKNFLERAYFRDPSLLKELNSVLHDDTSSTISRVTTSPGRTRLISSNGHQDAFLEKLANPHHFRKYKEKPESHFVVEQKRAKKNKKHRQVYHPDDDKALQAMREFKAHLSRKRSKQQAFKYH